jgi:hypothetical protein
LLPGVAAVLALLLAYPVRTLFIRSSIIACGVGILLLTTAILWRFRFWRWVPMAFAVCGVALMILPGRAVDRNALRNRYVQSLLHYEGTRYVWGGENRLGVDCSGLLRAALVDACWVEGIERGNPTLLRRAAWLWWHDESAAQMAADYLQVTERVGDAAPLKARPNEELAAGDFAVTADGSHVLAYAGEGRWIEADPYQMKVLVMEPGSTSPWWDVKVVPGRWRWLCPELR